MSRLTRKARPRRRSTWNRSIWQTKLGATFFKDTCRLSLMCASSDNFSVVILTWGNPQELQAIEFERVGTLNGALNVLCSLQVRWCRLKYLTGAISCRSHTLRFFRRNSTTCRPLCVSINRPRRTGTSGPPLWRPRMATQRWRPSSSSPTLYAPLIALDPHKV
jgi:hypothetical protein